MGQVVEIMVRGNDQERKAATLLPIPTAEAPASTRPQRLFLHPHLTVLLGPPPQGRVPAPGPGIQGPDDLVPICLPA